MKQLLKKYIDGNISPEEFDRLSSMVSACSDVELARLLDEDWRHFSTAFCEIPSSFAACSAGGTVSYAVRKAVSNSLTLASY